MGEAEYIGSEPALGFSSRLRDGQIFAQNSNCNVEEHYPIAYNLGSGRARWTGWINVDSSEGADVHADLRVLPIESDTADAVAAIHVLEHFYKWEVADILTEWRRILKPGGKMILELPCMDKVFRYISNCLRTGEPMLSFMTMYAFYGDPKYQDPLMCHKWGWLVADLKNTLGLVGMRNIHAMPPRYHFEMRDMRIECIK